MQTWGAIYFIALLSKDISGRSMSLHGRFLGISQAMEFKLSGRKFFSAILHAHQLTD